MIRVPNPGRNNRIMYFRRPKRRILYDYIITNDAEWATVFALGAATLSGKTIGVQSGTYTAKTIANFNPASIITIRGIGESPTFPYIDWSTSRNLQFIDISTTGVLARFGAKTLAGAGAFRPADLNRNAYDLTAYNSLVSGSLGSYTPSISGGGLRFTGGGAGAPAGAVLRCTHANGTIDITIGSLIANTYSVATLTEADAAYDASVLGDRIELRAGSHNPTAARTIVARSASPSGTWTGTAALSDGNWVVLTRDLGAAVTIGSIEIGGNGSGHARYLRLDDLDFVSPLTADGNGLGTGSVNGQIHFLGNGGSHVAVTNCRFSHVSTVLATTTGVYRSINSLDTSSVWLENNTITGCRHGIIGDFTSAVIRRNTIARCLSDSMQLNRATGALIEGNISKDKLYAYTELPILGITRGATTTVTVADSTAATVGEPCVFAGLTGALGNAINGQMQTVASKTATTIVLNINTSSFADWNGLGGTLQAGSALHGDHCQFTDNPGAANRQDNVTIRGNLFYRGNPGGFFPGGQGIFCGGNTFARTGWLVEGNIYHDCFVHGIRLDTINNSTFRSNTLIRQIGIDASSGGSITTFSTIGTCSGNVALDNIANAYSLVGFTTDTNNATVTLDTSDAVPATSTTIANYQAAFSSPNTVPNVEFDPVVAFATRTDAGSAYPGPIYPGATPYMNFTTLVYSNPR